MNLKSIKFKVTASKKWKCWKCKEELYGEKGFIHIVDSDFWRNSGNTRICLNCFGELLKEIEEDKKNRKERFVKLLKRNIIKHL